LLAFSVSAVASPSNGNGVGVNGDGQLVFSNENASDATGNPMDVPGVK